MVKPRFSVIIPTLNEEKFLPKLLASLVVQTQRDFEVIVVDGRSRDKTVEVAQSFNAKLPALVIEQSPKASLPLQRNLGARKAKGEWLVFVDADSIFLPYFIERISRFINEAHPELFTTWFRPDSEVAGDALLTLLADMFIEGSIVLRRQLSPGPLTVVSRQAYKSVNGYDENLTFGEDYDFAQRLSAHGIKLQILRETLAVYSLRRMRKEGKLKMLQFYAKVSLLALLTKKMPREVSGYVMGGHLYDKTKPARPGSHLKKLKKNLDKLTQKILG